MVTSNKHQPIWYRKFEDFLMPYQWIVSIMLIIIIAVSVWMLFEKDSVKRTTWVVYMYLP